MLYDLRVAADDLQRGIYSTHLRDWHDCSFPLLGGRRPVIERRLRPVSSTDNPASASSATMSLILCFTTA